ncbi:MAG: hypothetical protein IK120_09625 [Muribaculaceae bacterium]|nr:hypothetical protein [Muribaculaceae bacterium]
MYRKLSLFVLTFAASAIVFCSCDKDDAPDTSGIPDGGFGQGKVVIGGKNNSGNSRRGTRSVNLNDKVSEPADTIPHPII